MHVLSGPDERDPVALCQMMEKILAAAKNNCPFRDEENCLRG